MFPSIALRLPLDDVFSSTFFLFSLSLTAALSPPRRSFSRHHRLQPTGLPNNMEPPFPRSRSSSSTERHLLLLLLSSSSSNTERRSRRLSSSNTERRSRRLSS